MAITRIGYSLYTPTGTGGVTTRTITVPNGVQAGDFIVFGAVKVGSSNDFTLTTGPAMTDVAVSQVTGHTSHIWTRLADGTESGATITMTTPTAMRAAAAIIVYRGVASANVLDTYTYQQGGTKVNVVAPAATTTATDVRVDFALGTSNTVGLTFNTADGMTAVATIVDPATSGGGYVTLGAYENLTDIPASSAVGANTYVGSFSTNNTGWTLLLKEHAAASTVRPVRR